MSVPWKCVFFPRGFVHKRGPRLGSNCWKSNWEAAGQSNWKNVRWESATKHKLCGNGCTSSRCSHWQIRKWGPPRPPPTSPAHSCDTEEILVESSSHLAKRLKSRQTRRPGRLAVSPASRLFHSFFGRDERMCVCVGVFVVFPLEF